MESNKPNSFTFNIKEIIIEEVALEGLEGIGINLLWKRLGARISAPITDKMKIRFWSFIVNCKNISAYKVPEPVPDIEVVDRLSMVDEETGYLLDAEYLDGPYDYVPVDDDNGSCVHYKTRSLVSDDITSMSYEEVVAEYGNTLVFVASIEERWKALAPDLPISVLTQLGPLNYCMLELVGRARHNGQMTTGTTNLTKIVKDPKILFYHRKTLQNLDLVRVTSVTQVTAGRSTKSLLIRLKKFHKSDILTVPKSGIIRNLVDYLHDRPNFCEKTEIVIKKGLMTPAQNKRFQKKVSLFHFEEDPVSSDLVLTNTKDSDCPKKHVKKRYMCLLSKSDESSQSEDDEEVSQPLKCRYKIGVNVLRQAYERFLEAGRNGLTQHELTQLVGLEFYVGRTICRIFKSRNIIREFVECKGRQRIGRFIAIAATSKMDSKMAEEKEKLQKLLDEGDKLCKRGKRALSESSSDSETLIAKKKRKLQNTDISTAELGITEVKHIEGVRNPEDKKINVESKMSLRQLRYVNGILKIVHEKIFVQGYHTLSTLVATEYKEPPMDTKAMKLLLQGMVSSGNLKIFNMKLRQNQPQYIVLICAPHIKRNDPLIQTRYKELLHKTIMSQKLARKKSTNHIKPLTEYAYPRYVKVQKLHEALVNIMYFNDVKFEPSDLPHGFLSLKDIIPELPIEVALGHITSKGVIDVSKVTIDDSLLNVKVRDAPPDLCRALLKSKNLQSSLRSILKILAHFGLVQLVVQSTSDNDEIQDNSMAINLFYVNKHGKILDTSGVWPRKKPFNLEDVEREFNFETLGAAKEYWQAVYHISTNTTIEVPNRRQKHVKIRPPIRTITQALNLDNGNRFGNGLGPCGFDSLYYLDIPRLWKAYCIRSNPMKSKSNSGTVKIPRLEIPKKRKVQKKKNTVKKSKVEIPKAPPVKLGVKNKKRLRSGQTWTPDEDRLLMICKTAITIMSPISQPGCLRVRNLVAKDILSINDAKKTQSVCHKRAVFIDTNSTLMHERNCILNELRRHDIISKYEGLLKKVRILHSTNMSKYINEARKLMMELVWIIYEVSKSLPLLQEIPSIAINFEEFHKKYTITASASPNQCTNFYKMSYECEVNATLKEAILLTVMLSYQNNIDKKTAEIIYSYFSKFPERDLRTAIEPLRKCGAVAARDKVIRTHLHIVDLDDLTQSSYKISASYQRKWISRLNSDFVDNLNDSFDSDTNLSGIKASPEMNCFCFEQQASDTLDIVTVTVPVITGPSGSIIQEEQLNVIDIATNFKLKSGTIGWKNKTSLKSYSSLYKDIKVKDAFKNLISQLFIADKDILRKETTAVKNHCIVSYLQAKRETGATFNELQESLKLDKKTLIEDLSKLQDENSIKQVGYYKNILVLMEYVEPWCVVVPGGFIIPEPWLTLGAQIRPNIFYQWAGVIMNRVYEHPGCSLSYLSETCEFLTVRATQHICEMLQNTECITLHTLLFKEPSLFSEEDDVLTSEFGDYNEFESPQYVIAKPTKDCFSKYSYLRKIIMNSDTNV